MKSVLNIFCSAVLLSCSSFVFAQVKHTNDICPSIEAVAKVTFNNTAYNGTDGYWRMLSNHFFYQEKEWNVLYGIKLLNAKTQEEVLQYALPLYKNINLLEPYNVGDNDQKKMCVYKFVQKHMVFAVSPPLDPIETLPAVR